MIVLPKRLRTIGLLKMAMNTAGIITPCKPTDTNSAYQKN